MNTIGPIANSLFTGAVNFGTWICNGVVRAVQALTYPLRAFYDRINNYLFPPPPRGAPPAHYQIRDGVWIGPDDVAVEQKSMAELLGSEEDQEKHRKAIAEIIRLASLSIWGNLGGLQAQANALPNPVHPFFLLFHAPKSKQLLELYTSHRSRVDSLFAAAKTERALMPYVEDFSRRMNLEPSEVTERVNTSNWEALIEAVI